MMLPLTIFCFFIVQDTVVSLLKGTWFSQEDSVFSWKVSAEIRVHLIAKYFCTTKS